jgi:hypothetical protein
MLLYIIDAIINYCCFGKPKKEIKLIHRIKEDVLDLTEAELEQLRKHLGNGCC